MFVSVNFPPEIIEPLGSFTKPVMLPVDEAETVGANINTNVKTRVNKSEETLGNFMAGLRQDFWNAHLRPLSRLRYPKPLRPVGLVQFGLSQGTRHNERKPVDRFFATIMPK
jgi:hypothetical protein